MTAASARDTGYQGVTVTLTIFVAETPGAIDVTANAEERSAITEIDQLSRPVAEEPAAVRVVVDDAKGHGYPCLWGRSWDRGGCRGR